MATSITLQSRGFEEVNACIEEAFESGAKKLTLEEAGGQRYLGVGLKKGRSLSIYGTPGNDMACYMDGGSIEVFGNAQDQVGNTMNDGRIVIHGHCGDAVGYAMRGGEIFVQDSCGWRTGIHMKQFKKHRPVLVIGGDAGAFLGEYMAGGVIILMGKPGRYLGCGMHGGAIYLAGGIDESQVSPGLEQTACTAEDKKLLESYIARYNRFFNTSVKAGALHFTKLSPSSSRPYANMYVTA